MADIFLSYSRADRPTAQIIAGALEAEGFSVWWDKVLRAGQTYDEVTESMLRDSSVVIVLWSKTSVKSKWVRAEATLGQRGCELVPAMIEDADRPIMFELTQTADLIGWTGDRNEARWGEFVADIKRSLDKHGAETNTPATAPDSAAAPAGKDDATIETVFWTSIKDGSDPADFEAYLDRYADGHYASLARNRLAALGAASAPVATPPAPEPEPVPEPVTAAPVTPVPSATAPPSQQSETNKTSNPLPMILGAVVVLGVGGWFGLQAMNGGDRDVVEHDPIDHAPVVASCDACPEMVAIPGGSFTMGSPDTEANRSGNEGPVREVTLQPFAISATEVTWDQWQLCVDAGACNAAQGSGSGSFPVTGVSHDDARTYADWLSQQGDRRFRLPSEAQWEYAARGGTSTPYWWGTSFAGPGVVSGAAKDTAALQANAFGVSGMLGNVREWVADCYERSYANAPSDGRVVGGTNCSQPVVRGGSWKLGAAEHRAANRARYRRIVRDRALGFRVVAEPTRP